MTLAARLALLLIAAAAAAGCGSPRAQLDSHQLSLAAKSLASLSAEAQLLASQLESGSVTLAFTLVHAQALGDESLKVAKALARPAPEDLRAAQQRAVALNARLRSGLQQIAAAPARASQLPQLEKEFRSVRAEAKALEQLP